MSQHTPPQGVESATTRPTTGASAPATRSRRVSRALREVLLVVVGALLVSSLLRAWVGQMFVVPSPSMEETLQVRDRIVASKLSGYHRGSIVVFTDTRHWIRKPPKQRSSLGRLGEVVGVLPSTSSNHLVKRLIGLPGDHVVGRDGTVSVNGVALDEKSYVDSESGRATDIDFDVIVPAGHIFVMGDHRDASADSRCHLRDAAAGGRPVGDSAFVPESAVVGPVVAIAAPLSRVTTFSTPPTFDAIPAPAAAPEVGRASVTGPICAS